MVNRMLTLWGRFVPAIVATLAAAVIATTAGCEGGGESPGAGGAAGGTTATTTSAPDCPDIGDADAGPALTVTPTQAEEDLCQALAARAAQCRPECATEPLAKCEIGWACSKLSLRQEMVADLYACMRDLPCWVDDGDLLVTCATKLAPKYPPTAAQSAYESESAAWAEACGDPDAPAPCADGSCGGLSDDLYEAMTQCMLDNSNSCLGAAICTVISAELIMEGKCGALGAPDGGAGGGDAGTGGSP